MAAPLTEARLNEPITRHLRQDFAAYDRLYHLPAPRLKVVSTFPGPVHPWLAFGEEVLDAEVVHAIAPRAALTIVLVKGTSLDSAGQAVVASVAALRLGASEGGVISRFVKDRTQRRFRPPEIVPIFNVLAPSSGSLGSGSCSGIPAAGAKSGCY